MASTSFERVPVSAELEAPLRLYRRLYLSRIDLEEAKATIEELLRARLRLPRRNNPSPLLMAFTTALVVSYSRPFVNTRGQSEVADKTVPGSLLRTLSTRERELHNAVLHMRNRELAHSDADGLDLSIQLYANGDGAILHATRLPFLRIELRMFHRIISKVEAAIEEKCKELRKVLPLHTWL